MDIQRQIVHDFDFEIETGTPDQYRVKIQIPLPFDRVHLGALDLAKVLLEAIVEINRGNGMEKEPGFVKKLLGDMRIRMREEITKFDNVIVDLRRVKKLNFKGKKIQKWEFSLGLNTGSFTDCYQYSSS